MREEILRMEHVFKSFSDINVLSDFKLNIYKGEILGLLGLKHTGKTLVANIIAGIETIDSGFIYFEEEEIDNYLERKSRELGIFYVHNQLQIIPQLSIAENIFVIRDDNLNGLILNKKSIYTMTEKVLSKVELDILPDTKVEKLTKAQQDLVEIAKAVAENAKLIIIDDIIDSYTPLEMKTLKKVIYNLKKQGVSFLFISYKPEALLGFVDRIIILRNGKNIKTLYKEQFDIKLIYSLMLGYKFIENPKKNNNSKTGREILRVENLNTGVLTDISFKLRKSEVLGIFDIDNKSNLEIANVLYGCSSIFSGSIYIDKNEIEIKNINEAIKFGIGMIPREGINSALIMNMNFLDNLVFLIMKKISNKITVLNKRMLKYIKNKYINELEIDIKDKDRSIDFLDIYTNQRILFHRWLLLKPKILIFINPTDNVDLISKEIFLDFLDKFLKKGVSIIIISSNLSEVSSLCNRLILLKDKKIVSEYTQENVEDLNMDDFY